MKLLLTALSLTTLGINSGSMLINTNNTKIQSVEPIKALINVNIVEMVCKSSSGFLKNKIITWDQYATTWKEFTLKYHTMIFDDISVLGLFASSQQDYKRGEEMNINTTNIAEEYKITYQIGINWSSSISKYKTGATITIFHDDHYIYWDGNNWDWTGNSAKFIFTVPSVTFVEK